MDPLTQAILALWHKGLMPNTIAEELSVNQEIVEDIIEAPGNYAMQLADF
jgi:orotate phosphoribosyltransferase-like protein